MSMKSKGLLLVWHILTVWFNGVWHKAKWWSKSWHVFISIFQKIYQGFVNQQIKWSLT